MVKKFLILTTLIFCNLSVWGQIISGHVKYSVFDPNLFESNKVKAIGTDLNRWTGPLKIPYEFSRNLDTSEVEGIGTGAFYSQGITSLELPPNCRTIQMQAFMFCQDLQSVELKRGLKFIEEAAFKGCISLKQLILPPSIKFLGNEAFGGCSALEEVVCGEDLETMGNGAFARCTSLKKITFQGGRLTSIPYECFYDNGNLDIVDIPINVRSIGERAFRYCQKMRVVRWGKVKTIGAEAFAMCHGLQYIISDNVTPPAVNPSAFDQTIYNKAILLVPKGAESAYRQAAVWRNFVNIQGGDK